MNSVHRANTVYWERLWHVYSTYSNKIWHTYVRTSKLNTQVCWMRGHLSIPNYIAWRVVVPSQWHTLTALDTTTKDCVVKLTRSATLAISIMELRSLPHSMNVSLLFLPREWLWQYYIRNHGRCLCTVQHKLEGVAKLFMVLCLNPEPWNNYSS